MDVDFDNLTLTCSYISGYVLREELAKRGAVLRDADVNNNPDFLNLSRKEKWLKRIEQGKSVLYDVIDTQFVKSLFVQLKKVHASGFILNDIKYGNVIIEEGSGKPYLIDFDKCCRCSELTKRFFRILCERDIEKFNLHFGVETLTYN
jgi:serine/threonine protein kinase